jgi:HlyD family secretion protein
MEMRESESLVREREIRKSRTKSQKKTVFIIIVAFAVLIVAGFVLFSPKGESYTVKGYSTAKVAVKDITNTVSASGTIEVKLSQKVVALQEGFISALSVDASDQVKKGQVIGRIKSQDIEDSIEDKQTSLDSAQRTMESNKVEYQYTLSSFQRNAVTLERNLSDATDTLEKTKKLYAANAATTSDLKSAQDAQTVAKEAITTAKASIDEASSLYALSKKNSEADIAALKLSIARLKEELAECEVTAPFAGTVLSVSVTAGSYVSQYATILTIADTSETRVSLDVSEDSVGSVKKGMKVSLTLSTGIYSGTVEKVGTQAETNSSTSAATVPVYVTFDEKPGNLIPGSSASAEIALGSKQGALVLPRGAFLSSGDQSFVFVIHGGKAIKKSVTYGIIQSTQVEVTSGLSEGDQVITSGYQEYADRDEVQLSGEGSKK